jgi:hypothetical protein
LGQASAFLLRYMHRAYFTSLGTLIPMRSSFVVMPWRILASCEQLGQITFLLTECPPWFTC